MSERVGWERRAVLRGTAALTGSVAASGLGSLLPGSAMRSRARQQVDSQLLPGVTLFDLDDDGAYTATVERASAKMQDGSHPAPIHVTSGGQSTVDYAISTIEPPARMTLGDLSELTYDYYEGRNNANPSVSGGGFAPGETFLVVENTDGRHGMYLTYDDTDDRADERWWTFDVLALVRGDTAGTNGWYEYTTVEEGYDDQTFNDVIERFGADARLVRVGVGHGDAVNPAILDMFHDTLVINDGTYRFPVSVAKRISSEVVLKNLVTQ